MQFMEVSGNYSILERTISETEWSFILTCEFFCKLRFSMIIKLMGLHKTFIIFEVVGVRFYLKTINLVDGTPSAGALETCA